MEIIKQTFKERLVDACKLKNDPSLYLHAKRNQQRRLIKEQQLIQLLMNLRYDQFFCTQVQQILPILLPNIIFTKVDKSPTQKAIYFFHQFFQQAGLTARLNELIEMLQNKTSSKASIFSRLIVVLIQNSRLQFKQQLSAAVQLKQVRNGLFSQLQVSNKQPQALFKMDELVKRENQKLKLNSFVKTKRQTFTMQIKKRNTLTEKRHTLVLDKKEGDIAFSCSNLKKSIQVKSKQSIFIDPSLKTTKEPKVNFKQVASKFKSSVNSFIQLLNLQDCDFTYFKSLKKSAIQGNLSWMKQNIDKIIRQRVIAQPYMQSRVMPTQKNMLGSENRLKLYRYQNRNFRKSNQSQFPLQKQDIVRNHLNLVQIQI